VRATMPATRLGMSGTALEEYGVIVTAREQMTDERIVLHRPGAGALKLICEGLDGLDGDWRVLTISTPRTIYRDLQGTRARELVDETQMPELRMLGQVGRLDMLDPIHHAPALPRGQKHF